MGYNPQDPKYVIWYISFLMKKLIFYEKKFLRIFWDFYEKSFFTKKVDLKISKNRWENDDPNNCYAADKQTVNFEIKTLMKVKEILLDLYRLSSGCESKGMEGVYTPDNWKFCTF